MPKALPVAEIESAIRVIRGVRVMLDFDLAKFYRVTTGRLNEQFRRNAGRFPKDFAFQLTGEEVATLRSQIAISNTGRGGARYRPWAFTEHGVLMLASVLNSKVAIEASIRIVRSFVLMRQAMQIQGGDLIAKLAQMDVRLDGHDDTIEKVLRALNSLLNPPAKPSKEMGFHTLMEDTESSADLKNLPQRKVNYRDLAPKKRRARKEKR